MNKITFDSITIARFWSRVQVGAVDQCWEWMGARDEDGYGQIRLKQPRRLIATHRYSLALFLAADLPEGSWALHRCDNPPCCNPRHLYVGDRLQNIKDAWERGQLKPRSQKGALNPNARLSVSDVEKIRAYIGQGFTNMAIAAEFGVTHSMISAIRRGKAWQGIGLVAQLEEHQIPNLEE